MSSTLSFLSLSSSSLPFFFHRQRNHQHDQSFDILSTSSFTQIVISSWSRSSSRPWWWWWWWWWSGPWRSAPPGNRMRHSWSTLRLVRFYNWFVDIVGSILVVSDLSVRFSGKWYCLIFCKSLVILTGNDFLLIIIFLIRHHHLPLLPTTSPWHWKLSKFHLRAWNSERANHHISIQISYTLMIPDDPSRPIKWPKRPLDMETPQDSLILSETPNLKCRSLIHISS